MYANVSSFLKSAHNMNRKAGVVLCLSAQDLGGLGSNPHTTMKSLLRPIYFAWLL